MSDTNFFFVGMATIVIATIVVIGVLTHSPLALVVGGGLAVALTLWVSRAGDG